MTDGADEQLGRQGQGQDTVHHRVVSDLRWRAGTDEQHERRELVSEHRLRRVEDHARDAAVHDGVEEHDARSTVAGAPRRLEPVARLRDLEPLVPEEVRDELAQQRIVADDQHVGGGRGHGWGGIAHVGCTTQGNAAPPRRGAAAGPPAEGRWGAQSKHAKPCFLERADRSDAWQLAEPRAKPRVSVRPSTRNLALLAGLVALVSLVSWLLVGQRHALAPHPLGRAPEGATAVAWIDIDAVLESTLWSRLVRARGGDAGIRQIERQCGFDPIAQLDDLVLFAMGDEPQELERVGVIARGVLDHEALARCVAEVVKAEGGEVRRIEIGGVPAVAGRGSSRAAFIGADGVVAGSEQIVRDVVGVVHEGRPSADDDATLSRLWGRVAGGRHVAVVGHLPAPWRRTIRGVLRDADRASLSSLAGARAFGLGLRVTRGLGAGAAIEMDHGDQAREAVAALRAEIDRTLDDTLIALSPVAPALRRVDVEAQGSDVIVTVELSPSQVDELIDLGEDLWERGEERAERRAARPRAPAPQPDAVLRPED